MNPSRTTYLLLTACLVLTAICYWPGLYGPFLFDDLANLAPIERWLDGEIGWQQIVFDNRSGPLGRSISMASFLASATISGMDPFAFKLGNLLIHLATGTGIFLLLRRICARDPQMARNFSAVALVVTAVWLLHPFLSSTVLYTVQRMAMLSALFVVLAMLAYMVGRARIERGGDTLAGSAWLFAAVPLLTACAALSKENGLLAPMLCGVLELVYFRPAKGEKRPMPARIFITIGLIAPIVLALGLLAIKPDFYFGGYANRPFGPVERLLTQARVLFDYLHSLLLPAGNRFSLFRDDYTISTGLLSPVTTLLSILGLSALAALALLLRKRIPGFSAGIGIFLVGHAMESSLFPLLIYFEHRNYLASLGIFLATASLLVHGWRFVSARIDNPKTVAIAGAACLATVLAFSTYTRALRWQSHELLVQQSVENFPDSRFGRMEMANLEMNRMVPDPEQARMHYRHLTTLERPSTRFIGRLGLVAVDCFADQSVESGKVDKAFSITVESLEADMEKALSSLATIVSQRDCDGLSRLRLAENLAAWLDRIEIPERLRTKWRLRYLAARLYLRENYDTSALEQAKIAWETGVADPPVAMLMAALNIRLGNHLEASRLLDTIEDEFPDSDATGQRLLKEYRAAIEAGEKRTFDDDPLTDFLQKD